MGMNLAVKDYTVTSIDLCYTQELLRTCIAVSRKRLFFNIYANNCGRYNVGNLQYVCTVILQKKLNDLALQRIRAYELNLGDCLIA